MVTEFDARINSRGGGNPGGNYLDNYLGAGKHTNQRGEGSRPFSICKERGFCWSFWHFIEAEYPAGQIGHLMEVRVQKAGE